MKAHVPEHQIFSLSGTSCEMDIIQSLVRLPANHIGKRNGLVQNSNNQIHQMQVSTTVHLDIPMAFPFAFF